MVPDLVGFKLNKAIDILKSEGFTEIHTLKTSDPRDKEPFNGESRIVRIKVTDSGEVELLVCR